MPKKLPKILRNRYAVVLIGFFVYITFFDAHDLISQMQIKYESSTIRDEIKYLEADTKQAKGQIEELTTNKASLEKFAREQYRMKRENEDIFVIVGTDEK
jgi:cell division protein FtsB